MDPLRLICPRRAIQGVSAVLLPYTDSGEIDWPSFAAHLQRTAEAGLIPAVNMDTGYGHLLTADERRAVLNATRSTLGNGAFFAGAWVIDTPGTPFQRDAYCRALEEILQAGGTPVVFQSYGLTGLPDNELIAAYEEFGRFSGRFVAFELGPVFAPFGKIYSLEVFEALLAIPQCVGAKHSSLSRVLEWQRLELRNRRRPDFRIYTGNDWGIDMVMYGSDYLLGLSTCAPDLFARRDRLWQQGDPAFYELNDRLQYLGWFVFRPPVPAYKHAAAMFLKIRGWLPCDATHPRSPTRPDSDRDILRVIAELLGC
ncbi:MAG: dihydrodipicolinate synthase family protein [Gemmataceae bacterium]|nr:dihydrodipicolinate synthase family protein [Gemmataceae bacterium]